ncbi:bZIP transcription factor 44 [Elaeis guineensis]|uniref:BZIP transcription factor 11 n=1 Tax=Elaeis guineensis var. tenera TaxID=51953 RepID=A0A6I9R9L6_ELAGV|nr:bZIP transcription factor 11 [Elaeis guineensis]
MSMTSSSGTSSGSSGLLLPGSEAAAFDQKKQKRMLSNRESARRSRMRKQKHLDDLRTQVSQLRQQGGRILAALNHTTKQYVGVETENSVLRTQMMELTSRLNSLHEILHFLNGGDLSSSHGLLSACEGPQIADGFGNPCNSVYMSQPIMASADMLQYYY